MKMKGSVLSIVLEMPIKISIRKKTTLINKIREPEHGAALIPGSHSTREENEREPGIEIMKVSRKL